MSVWEIIAEQHRLGQACVVATILQVRGSVPGVVGAKAVITASGLRTGTLGGGKVEAKAIGEAMRMLASGEPLEEITWNLQRDVGMTCGGEMRFLFELVEPYPAWHVVVFGAGHVAQEVVRILSRLACKVDIFDPRHDWLEKLPIGPNICTHHVSDYPEGATGVTKKSFVLCLTKGHSTDRPVLSELFRRFAELPFVGVIGSAAKRAVLLRELREDNIPDEQLATLVCPVGLPIGSNDPAEIAVSIVAQLLERRSSVPMTN